MLPVFLSFLNLWEHVRGERGARSSNQFRKMCRAEFLNHLRVREWQDVHGQLRQVLRSLRIQPNTQPGRPDQIHRSLLAGLLSHVGMRDGLRHELTGARNSRFALVPGSTLFKRPHTWIMVAELVETTRLWGRVAARIEPAWAEDLGGHLVKHSHGEPWWDEQRGAAMVNERVTLYGLPVVEARTVQLGRVDPDLARELFIHHALVGGEWSAGHAFIDANAGLVADVWALEDRVRRRDILVSDENLFAFYDHRVGPAVTSTRRFDAWWKEERRRRPELLTFTLDDLIDPAAGDVSTAAYPDSWQTRSGLTLGLSYRFDPTSDLDGVTVDIPLPVMNRVDPDGLDWQVPGLRTELVTALIRSLPKAQRRHLNPATEHTAAFLEGCGPADGPLRDVLARELTRATGQPISAESFDLDRVPDHLRMTFRVMSERGRPLAWSKDLPALRSHLQSRLRTVVAGATRSVEQEGLTAWTIGTLPRSVEAEAGGHTVTAHPALVDEGATVAIRTFPTPSEQADAMWAGTRRLLLLTGGSPQGALERLVGKETKLGLARAPFATAAEVLEDCITCALDQVLADADGPAWDEAGFEALQRVVADELVDLAVDVATRAGRILTHARQLERRLDDLTAAVLQPALTDVHIQIARLVHPGFVATTGAGQLIHLPRYLQAVDKRLDKLVGDPRRDRELMAPVQRMEDALDHLRSTRSGAGVTAIRWMIEELRVSLFAQSLGTPRPVSEQRIAKEIARLEGPAT